MRKEIMTTIFHKIKEYNRIILFRHVRNDGDCVGSTKGMEKILKATFPHKEIYNIETEPAQYLAFLGPDDGDIEDELYRDALAIVLDTSNMDRISNQKFRLCREVIKIDHHIDHTPYGDYSWVEPEKSSACELVVEFYDLFREELVMTKEAAQCLYCGMVTDTGRFRYSATSGDTLRNAGILLDQGIDTEMLYANLYLEDLSRLQFKAYLYNAIRMTENGVAYLFVDKAMQEKFQISLETASTAVSTMDSIRGSICWIAFIETDDNIRVRLRSRFMDINTLAEKYHGGGHAKASGATVYSRQEMDQLLSDADALIKDYKQTHEGWL